MGRSPLGAGLRTLTALHAYQPPVTSACGGRSYLQEALP